MKLGSLSGIKMARMCLASGQNVNFEKLLAFFSPNTPITLENSICDALKVKLMGPKDKYVGLPSHKVLSQAGSEVLIKSVIRYPNLCDAMLSTSKRSLEQAYGICPSIFWGADSHDQHIHWKSWEKLTDPKVDGGLEFCGLKSFNTSLLAKQGWRLLMNPGSFWVKVINGLCFPRSNFLTAKHGSRPSWLWNSLLHGRDLLLHGVGWQVGNGQSILFWTQKWVPFNEDFFIHSLLGPFPNGVREAEIIFGIPISQNRCPDKLVWHFDAKATVKHLLFECAWTRPVWFGSTLSFRNHPSGTSVSLRFQRFVDIQVLAVHYACQLAFRRGWSQAIVESDCQTSITLSSTETIPSWNLAALISDIRSWSANLQLSFSWTKRDNNKVAHWATRFASLSALPFRWDTSFPYELSFFSRSDMHDS
nr:cytochrome P450 [Tanacetum cinerariifolium]